MKLVPPVSVIEAKCFIVIVVTLAMAVLAASMTGCASIPDDPPYWYVDRRLACDVEPVVIHAESSRELSIICGLPRTASDACIKVRPGRCMIALGPAAGDCELSHEKRHAKGWNHDSRSIYRQDCG